MIDISDKDFKEKIFDYERQSEWKFKGSKSTIIYFSADYCQPCRAMKPAMKEVHKKYSDQVDVYTVDIDEHPVLAKVFNVMSIPTLLVIPNKGEPSVNVGAISGKAIDKIFQDLIN